MHRWEHFITPARGGRLPGRVVALDCDGTVSEGAGRPVTESETLAGWAVTVASRKGETWGPLYFLGGTRAAGAWKWLADQTRRPGVVWVMSHRALRCLSLLGFWRLLETGEAELCHRGKWQQRQPTREAPERVPGYLVCDDPPTAVRFRLPGCKGQVQWVDVRNYGVSGPPDGPGAAGRAAWVLDWWVRALGVCRSDGLGSWQPTAGAQAMYAWRRSHYTEPVLCHAHPPTLRLEREAYHAGRAEAFRLGRAPGPAYLVDARALYPWLCSVCGLPSALLDYEDLGGAEVRCDPDWGSDKIAEVTVETDEPAYPRSGHDPVVWPVGRFKTVLCGPELMDALARDRVRRVWRTARYQMGWPLRSLAVSMLALRRSAEGQGWKAGAAWVKAMSVALPGKFGQTAHRWEPAPWQEATHPYRQWWAQGRDGSGHRYRSVAWRCWEERHGDWSEHSCPQIAAWVTSLGRRWLLGRIRDAGREHVHYVCTDGLWVDEHGLNNLRVRYASAPGDDGGLRVQQGPETLYVYGVNDWQAGPVVKRAGQPKGEERDGVEGPGAWRRLGLGAACRAGMEPGSLRGLVEYARDGHYRHGTVLATGEVHPIRLWED